MSTINEDIFDEMVRRSTYFSRYALGLRKRTWELLAQDVDNIRVRFIADLAELDEKPWQEKWRPFLRVLYEIEAERNEAWDEAEVLWDEELPQVAEEEESGMSAAFLLLPYIFKPKLLTKERKKIIAKDLPYQGMTPRQWLRSARASDRQRITGALQGWLYDNRPGAAARAVRALLGTKAANGTDGLLYGTHANLQAAARTVVNGIMGRTREDVIVANSAAFAEERYTAVLDGATTAICRSLDGNIYKVGEGPVPPLHINCRSMRIPVVRLPVGIAVRPTPETEEFLRQRFIAQEGINRVGKSMREKFDAYVNDAMRGMIGEAPELVDYQTWLRRQPAQFQDEVLGKAKGKLFREGGLTLDKFVARDGTELTLAQLAKTNAQAFRSAGLDPKKYLNGNGAG